METTTTEQVTAPSTTETTAVATTDSNQATAAPVETAATTEVATPSVQITDEHISTYFGRKPEEVRGALQFFDEKKGNVVNNPLALRVDELLAKGVSLNQIASLEGLDFNTMADAEAVRQAMKLENPFLTDADIDAELNYNYKLSETYLDDEKAYGQTQLKKAAAAAKQTLTAHKERIFSGGQDPAVQKQEDARKTSWQNEQFQVTPIKQTYTVKAHAADGTVENQEVPIAFEFDANEQAAIADMAKTIAIHSNKPYNAEAKAETQKLAMELYLGQNFDKLVERAIMQTKSADAKAAAVKYHNAQGVKDPNSASATPAATPKDDYGSQVLRFVTQR